MKGFSLIETIIGLALVLIAVTFFGVILFALPLTQTARNQNVAYHIAGKKIEELRNVDFDSLPQSGTFSDPDLSNLEGSTAELAVSDYEASNDIKQVNVTVRWIEQASTDRLVEVETLISRNGLSR